MEPKSVHEPKAKVMSASDVWNDAQEIASVLKQNILKAEPMVPLQIPLSTFLSAVGGTGPVHYFFTFFVLMEVHTLIVKLFQAIT